MITVPFDVNDPWLRNAFLQELLPDLLDHLTTNSRPEWGAMNSHEMTEHLLWAFKISVGETAVPCMTNERLLPRVRKFLYDATPTPRGFKNPLLGDTPPPCQTINLQESRTMLKAEIAHFSAHCMSHPGATAIHPIFGCIGIEEWERAHFKHCYHHFLQFKLIQEPESAEAAGVRPSSAKVRQ